MSGRRLGRHHAVTTSLTPGSAPVDITAGPDGNLWFTQSGLNGGIGRIMPTGDWPTDARDDPGVGVLAFDQSTPPGATERIHSRKAAPPTRA